MRQINPQKGKRKGKLKINPDSPNRIPPSLHPRKELNENLSILVSSVRRITTPRISLGGPMLVDF